MRYFHVSSRVLLTAAFLLVGGALTGSALELSWRASVPFPGYNVCSIAAAPLEGLTGNAVAAIMNSSAESLLAVVHHTGTTYEVVWTHTDAPGYDGLSVAIGDADNDGRNELLAAFSNYQGGRVALFKWNGIEFEEIWSTSIKNDGDQVLAIGDADRDSQSEIIVGESYNGKRLRVFEYQGPGLYSTSFDENVGSDVHSVRLADADNDGFAEIIVGTAYWNDWATRVYRYDGVTYELLWKSPAFSPTEAAGGDATGDGQKEVLSGSNGAAGRPPGLRLYRGDPTGNFNLLWEEASWVGTAPFIGDVCGLGEAFAGFTDRTSSPARTVFLAWDGSALTEATSLSVTSQDTVLADADNDGLLDVLVALADEIAVYGCHCPDGEPARLPEGVGNTLLAIEAGQDVRLAWQSSAESTSYNVRRDTVKRFDSSVIVANTDLLTHLDTPPVTEPLFFYRINGVNCFGREGP